MPRLPLVFHSSLDGTIAWRDGVPVPVRDFLADVTKLAAALPQGGHVFNACKDRYRFAVGLCAALVAGKVSLLPSMHTPETVRQLASFAPDSICLHDTDDCAADLPRVRFPDLQRTAQCIENGDATAIVPHIDASCTMAYVFTSGSTGTPVPHRKTWGSLVKSVRAAATRLSLSDAAGTTLVGTVPPQHMYGLESTVLLALIGGLAFSNRQPFYPADIRTELERVPQPRVFVTSPIHMRVLLMSESTLPPASLILSATAPLSEKLAADAEARFAAPLMEIYGSTETGQIATRRTARSNVWQLLPGITLDTRSDTHHGEDDVQNWAFGGHIEEPVLLGDTVKLLDDAHFLLQGRKGDLINIAGKRTSLAHLNHQLTAIPGVNDGVFFFPDDAKPQCRGQHESVTRLLAFAVAPALSAGEVQRALRKRIDAAFMPRPLVLVDSLPRAQTGKLPHAALAALAARHRHGAPPAAGRGDAQTRSIAFDIPIDHPALPGHFPGQPIVPAVMLLERVLSRIGAALERPSQAWTISSAKFPNPAMFGVPFELSFYTNESGAIHFAVRAGARTVATGVLTERPSV
jgi:acyl-coenzyme A synthetase/AMP-(fatty) acid ligase